MPVSIPLSRGMFALVEEADAERVLALSPWHVVESDPGRFYAARVINGRRVFLHRLLMNAPPDKLVDHEDGDGLNCRRTNMRVCTTAQNMLNRRRHSQNRSGFKGVAPSGGGWKAYIARDGYQHHLGCFARAEEAALAYNEAAVRLHGAFARLNEIPAGAA